MGISDVFILALLYAFFGIFIVTTIIFDFKKRRNITYFAVARIMYLVVYSIVPAAVHFYVYNNGNSDKHYATILYTRVGIIQLYASLIFEIIGYLALSFGYSLVFKSTKTKQLPRTERLTETKYSEWFTAATIMLILGLCAQLLWTNAYGGIVGVLQYSSSLRSGYDIGISNSYTVFKRFVPLVQFANIIFMALLAKRKKVMPFIFCVISTILSWFYLLANDGRAPLVMHFLSLFIVWWLCRDIQKKIKLWKLVIFGVFALLLMNNMDVILAYLVYDEAFETEISFDILKAVREEFSFVVRNGQAVLEYLEDYPFTFRLPQEILSGILGVLPSSFRPESIVKLEVLNTEYWTRSTSIFYGGGKPPDLVSVGIYTMNYLGVFLLPLFFGIILRILDDRQKKVSKTYGIIKFALLLYPLARTIAYANFDGLTLSFFYIVIGYAILYIVKRMRVKQ